MKNTLSESSKVLIEKILKEKYIPSYPVPTMRDESYIMLMLAFSVAKRNIYQLVVYNNLPEDKEELMIEMGVKVIKGTVTPEAYYNKFISIIKEVVKEKLLIDTPDFLKTQIIARLNASKNQIVNVNLKEGRQRTKKSCLGDFNEDIEKARTIEELERVKRSYGQNWFEHLPPRHQNVVAEAMDKKLSEITMGRNFYKESTNQSVKYSRPSNCVLCGAPLPKNSFSSVCPHCEATQKEEEKSYFSEDEEKKTLETPESTEAEDTVLNQPLDEKNLQILKKNDEGQRYLNNVYFLFKKYPQVLDVTSDPLKSRLKTELEKSQKLESMTLQTILDIYTAQKAINNQVALKNISKELIQPVTSFITELTDSLNKNIDLSETDTVKAPVEEDVLKENFSEVPKEQSTTSDEQILRTAIAAEIDAINLYQQMSNVSDEEEVYSIEQLAKKQVQIYEDAADAGIFTGTKVDAQIRSLLNELKRLYGGKASRWGEEGKGFSGATYAIFIPIEKEENRYSGEVIEVSLNYDRKLKTVYHKQSDSFWSINISRKLLTTIEASVQYNCKAFTKNESVIKEADEYQEGKGFKYTYHMGFRWWRSWSKIAQRKNKLVVEYSKEDNCWLVYLPTTPTDHILTYNVKTGEVFTDLSLDDLKAFKTKPTEEVLTEDVLEEAYFDIDKPITLYHATPRTNLKSIMKQGLLPSEATSKTHSKPLVWLADSPSIARGHAIKKVKNISDLAVLEITLDPKKDKVYKALLPGIYTVEGIITPDKIKYLK